MAFTKKYFINIQHVDVAGVIFFPKLYEFCQTTLEAFLIDNKIFISKLIKEKTIPFIVESKSQYFKPLRLGDEILVELKCEKIGHTSFSLNFSFTKDTIVYAQAETVHVFTQQGEKVAIPEAFKKVLNKISD